MGSAILSAILEKKVFPSSNITVSDPDGKKLNVLKEKLSVNVSVNNADAVKQSDIILLAVKPQEMRSVLSEIQSSVLPSTLLLSIAAGFSIHALTESIGRDTQPVVRVMPNLPAKVGKSVSGWISNSYVSSSQKKLIKQILLAIGVEFELKNESMIDAVTAISGSGPAYVYYFIESIVEAAKALDFDEKNAYHIVLATFEGALKLLKKDGRTPKELRHAVTSKRGTTEAAVALFDQKGLKDIIRDGILKAYNRAQELSK